MLFDLDGVIANADHRQHLLAGPGKKDWKRFFAAAGDDLLIEEVAALTVLLDPSLQRILLTARPTSIRDVTLEWLSRFSVRWDVLVMRREGDFAASPDAKRHAVEQLRDHGFQILLAFDDDQRNVEMFRSEGIRCVYIHSGYYEA